VQPFAVALTPPPDALAPGVARLEAESAAEAAAIRAEEAKTRQKQWRKSQQAASGHRVGESPGADEQEDRGMEKGKEETGGHEIRHHHGDRRPHEDEKEKGKEETGEQEITHHHGDRRAHDDEESRKVEKGEKETGEEEMRLQRKAHHHRRHHDSSKVHCYSLLHADDIEVVERYFILNFVDNSDFG